MRGLPWGRLAQRSMILPMAQACQ
eukprot:SAG22_NODE_20739_length_263_cov_0.634146_1_plen_23_part_01